MTCEDDESHPFRPNSQMDFDGRDINKLLRLETELNELPPSIERSAKVNLLKYLQVNAVVAYERVSTGLYFNLRRDEGFQELYRIEEKAQPEGGLVQPMETGSIEDYLLQAEEAKVCLDKLIYSVAAPGTPGREGISDLKSVESTRRKADDWGGIRYVTDLARATVVCETPHDLAHVFESLTRMVGQVCMMKVALYCRILTQCSLHRVTMRWPLGVRCRRSRAVSYSRTVYYDLGSFCRCAAIYIVQGSCRCYPVA